MTYEDDWNYFGIGSLDDGSTYDDGEDRYLGDPDPLEEYPYGGLDCE